MQLSQTTDEHTVVRAAQTDAQAFAALYDRYVQRVYRYCYYRTNSAPDGSRQRDNRKKGLAKNTSPF